MPLSFDPEYLKAIEPMIPSLMAAPKPDIGDIASRRTGIEGLLVALSQTTPDVVDVEHTIYHGRSQDGFEVPIYRFAKKVTSSDSSSPAPAIVHIHGGGYICLSVETYKKSIETMVSLSGVQFFSVDYRLAPEAQYPKPVEDCYAGLQWVYEHVKDFNIDPARIAVMGESAGGGLAAAVALLARDRALSPPLAKQILIYPMLDDRNNVPLSAVEPFATWNIKDNITGWKAYIGENAAKDGVSRHAAPARTETVDGLPSTYIDVGGLDIFCSEDVTYANRLLRAGIPTELHVYPGLPHAFEAFAPNINVVTRAIDNRIKAVLSI